MTEQSQLTESLETTFRTQRASLIWELRARFEVLNEQQCEDLVQFAFQQALTQLSLGDLRTYAYVAGMVAAGGH